MGWVQYRCDFSCSCLLLQINGGTWEMKPRTAPNASGHSPILGANFGPSKKALGGAKKWKIGR